MVGGERCRAVLNFDVRSWRLGLWVDVIWSVRLLADLHAAVALSRSEMIMHPSVHRSLQHRHYLRQVVIAPASYSPTSLDVTNALRMTLLTGDFELGCARHIRRLALAPPSSLPLWPVGCPPRICIHAPVLHRYPRSISTLISSTPLYLRICCMRCKSHCSSMVKLHLCSHHFYFSQHQSYLVRRQFQQHGSRCPV